MFLFIVQIYTLQVCNNPFENFAPGLYFQDNNNKSINCVTESNTQQNQTQSTTPSTNSATQTYPHVNTSNQNTSQPVYQPVQFPNQVNTPMSNISPMYTQPPAGVTFTAQCDNSAETDKFKACVQNAIKSLKSIIANCKRTLGDDAPECCVDDKCLDSIKKKSSKKSESIKEDSLKEFLTFLKKEIECKEKKHKHKRRRDDYREKSYDDHRKSSDRESKCKDPCEKSDEC